MDGWRDRWRRERDEVRMGRGREIETVCMWKTCERERRRIETKREEEKKGEAKGKLGVCAWKTGEGDTEQEG